MQEQISQQNSTLARLTDTEVMLAAMATSKALAAEELQKHACKHVQFEAEKRCMVEQYEQYKVMVEELEKEKLQISKQLSEIISENESVKKENTLLIEIQSQLQKQVSELTMEVKDLQRRLTLGGEEYRRKYIEWHKLLKKVQKLQQKLQEGQREKDSASISEHSAKDHDRQSVSSDTNDLISYSMIHSNAETRPTGFTQSVPFANQVLASEHNSAILNQEQRAKIHAEMENQLSKFHGRKSPSSSPTPTNVRENELNTDGHSNSTSGTWRYPYPPYYPYPYPRECMKASACSSMEYSCIQSPYNYPQSSSHDHLSVFSYANEDSFAFLPSPELPPRPPNPVSEILYSPQMNQASPYNESLSTASTQEEGIIDARPKCIMCPICDECFPENKDINEHIDGHLYLKCPVCADLFDKELFGIENFNKHVTDHLD